MDSAAAEVVRLTDLEARITAATGPDAALDAAIAAALGANVGGGQAPGATASVDRCLDLAHRHLPDWHWHVGFGVTGIMPYATLAHGSQRFEATAATVPLALLSVIIQAVLARAHG